MFCEWAYVVDYDANTFEIYEGFNKEEVTPDNRFYDIKPDKDSEYTQVKLVKKYSLDNLPSCDEFVFVLEPSEEEE